MATIEHIKFEEHGKRQHIKRGTETKTRPHRGMGTMGNWTGEDCFDAGGATLTADCMGEARWGYEAQMQMADPPPFMQNHMITMEPQPLHGQVQGPRRHDPERLEPPHSHS